MCNVWRRGGISKDSDRVGFEAVSSYPHNAWVITLDQFVESLHYSSNRTSKIGLMYLPSAIGMLYLIPIPRSTELTKTIPTEDINTLAPSSHFQCPRPSLRLNVTRLSFVDGNCALVFMIHILGIGAFLRWVLVSSRFRFMYILLVK